MYITTLAAVFWKLFILMPYNTNSSNGKFLLKEKKYLVTIRTRFYHIIFYADFVVSGKIILELKPTTHLNDAHMAQCLNYLKISGLKLSILANFEAERLIHHEIIS